MSDNESDNDLFTDTDYSDELSADNEGSEESDTSNRSNDSDSDIDLPDANPWFRIRGEELDQSFHQARAKTAENL